MAAVDLDAEPGGELLERIAGEIRFERARPASGCRACAALSRGYPRARAFALEHRKVEAERVADHDRSGETVTESGQTSAKVRRTGHGGVVDAMDALKPRRNGFARINEPRNGRPLATGPPRSAPPPSRRSAPCADRGRWSPCR